MSFWDEEKCQRVVSDNSRRYGGHQCRKKPVKKVNGKPYCAKHAKIVGG